VFEDAKKKCHRPLGPGRKPPPRPFCVKFADGSIKQITKIGPPCGKDVLSFFRGTCSELQNKNNIQK